MGIIKNEDPAAGSTGLRALTAFKNQLEESENPGEQGDWKLSVTDSGL